MECPACHFPNNDSARFCEKCGALLPASADAQDPLIGTTVGGRFRIAGILGEGGMGRVYNGEQQMGTSVRKVAVKTLLAQYAKDPQVLARFMRECGTVSELEHPNTIKVYDYGKTDSGELYIAMELLSGESLEAALERGPMPAERVDRILDQVTGSLFEAHEKGIVHRDLKPANIYLTKRAGEEDYVKVLDFGIAKKDDKHSKAEQKLTQQGTVLGTPPYMSPEQFKGGELDAKSDIYSLGVMTYEMLTGRLPFDADTPWAWATQHMTAQPFPFETVPMGGSIPPKMKAAVMRALSKEKERRQQTAREFFEELTLGTTRSSRTSHAEAQSVAGPGGTAFMQAQQPSSGQTRGGTGTQIGEPMFSQGAPPMMDGTPSAPPGYSSDPSMHPGQPSVPTGSGQAYPAPPPPPQKKGGSGAIIAIVGVLVAGAAGTVIFLALHGGGKDSGNGGTTTSTATAAHSAAPKAEPGCEQVIEAAKTNVTTAVEAMGKCPAKATNHGEAVKAINTKAVNDAEKQGCAAMEEARRAASVDALGAYNLLQSKKCK